jgi:N-acetylglutamate synthase-like GNAT family acetyltransferase
MSIRKAGPEDSESILSIIITSNNNAYKSIIPPEQFKDPVLTTEQLKEEFDKMTFYTYGLENKAVGVAALGTDKSKNGIVRWVHVLPEHRRKGVGTSLMRHIEREAKKAGMKKLKVVYVWEKAYWAKNFYAKLGYERRGSIALPWNDQAYVYEKTLLRACTHPRP